MSDQTQKKKPVAANPIIPFFLAVAPDAKTALKMLKSGNVGEGGYVSSSHVTYVWSGGDNPDSPVTRIFVQGGTKEKYVPLTWGETIALFEFHGYKFAGPEQFRKVKELRKKGR